MEVQENILPDFRIPAHEVTRLTEMQDIFFTRRLRWTGTQPSVVGKGEADVKQKLLAFSPQWLYGVG